MFHPVNHAMSDGFDRREKICFSSQSIKKFAADLW
jgi:hypothetical protein